MIRPWCRLSACALLVLGIVGVMASVSASADPPGVLDPASRSRGIRLVIRDFRITRGDKRFSYFGRSLSEGIAVSLAGDERIAYIERGDVWAAAVHEWSIQELQRDPELIFHERVLDRLGVDLVVRGRFRESGGAIRVEGVLEDRRASATRQAPRAIEISPTTIDSRQIYEGLERLAREVYVAVLAAQAGVGRKRLVVACFTDGAAGADVTAAERFSFALLRELRLPTADAIPWTVAHTTCRNSALPDRELAKRADAAAVLGGIVKRHSGGITVESSLYFVERDVRVDIGVVKEDEDGLFDIVGRIATDVREILDAISTEAGEWEVATLRLESTDASNYVEHGKAYAANRKFALAALMFDRALRMKKDAETYVLLADARKAQDRVEDAQAAMEQALILAPSSIPVLRSLAALYQSREDLENASATLEKARALDPKSDQTLLQLAEVYTLTGEPDLALDRLREATSANPQNAETWTRLGQAYRRKGNTAEARKAFEQAIVLNPNDEDVSGPVRNFYVNEAMDKIRGKQFASAIADLQRAKMLKSDASLYATLLFALNNEKRYDEAVRTFDEAKVRGQTNAAVYNNFGFALEKLQKDQEALSAYDEAIRLNPAVATFHSNKANLLGIRLKRPKDGLKVVDDAISADPRNADPTLYVTKAYLLEAVDRLDEALDVADEAIKRGSQDDADARRCRAFVLAELGRLSEALAEYEQVILRYPDNLYAHNSKAFVLVRLQRFVEAEQSADTGINLDPDFGNLYAHKGMALYRQGKLAAGRQHLAKAIVLAPTYGGAYFYLAQVDIIEGNSRSALENLKKAIDAASQYRRRARTDPAFDPLKNDPTFTALVRS